ncbi:MAG: nuclear transport factor 2 family protein [Limisphaerales bacterium]
MNTRTFLTLLAVLTLVATPASFAADTPASNEQRVRDYVAACNKREVDTMLSMVADDIQWLTVTGDKITVETQGKPQLRASMEAYFKSTPSAKSELEWVQATASRVAALEHASWQGKSGPKSQASLSVYEFRGGLISRVYYYPVEK